MTWQMRSIVLWVGLALLVGCGSAPVHKPAELTEFQSTATLKILWQGSVGSAEKDIFFPGAFGNVVYATGATGGVTGFDKGSGRPMMSIDAGERVSGGVGAGVGLVLLGTPKGRVLAFNPEGKPMWQAQLSSEVLAPPEAQEGIVVVRTGDGRIHGLDVATGKGKWVYQRALPALSVRTHAGVVVRQGGVFVG
ncbi:MAG: PQQ-binding-like beta-propeller repeat protein, partial [Burkholderiales bacterium]